jgi:hypothetical protein
MQDSPFAALNDRIHPIGNAYSAAADWGEPSLRGNPGARTIAA